VVKILIVSRLDDTMRVCPKLIALNAVSAIRDSVSVHGPVYTTTT
jgi:hypothetical protein